MTAASAAPPSAATASSASAGSDAAATSPQVLDLLIVGAGFGGLVMLHKALTRGWSAQVLEAAAGVGGTWFHNCYPGARVDIQSMEYSFGFSDELQQEWRWSERYSPQPDLQRYAEHIADRFALRPHIRLNSRVVQAWFDEADALWHVRSETEQGSQTSVARFVVMATGPLSAPNTPRFEGLERFQDAGGEVHHTARWPKQPVDFSGKRVAVIGTGSSGVQIIPLIAQQAARLTVFQRTAAYAVPAHNDALDRAHEADVKSRYADFRARNRRTRVGFGCDFPPNPLSALAVDDERRQAMFEERWRVGGFSFLATFNDLMMDARANELAAEFIRAKIRSIVDDPAVARRLSPRHTLGCKRLCVDSGYYATFNRPNVQLVDVSQDPIVSFTETGLRTRDGEYAFDMLVLATGFDAMTGTLTRMDLRGRGGLTMREKWRDGPANYLGLMIAGFPNLFCIAGPGSTSAFTNVTVSIEHHVDWIADCIGHLEARGVAVIEATEEAEAQWVERVNRAAAPTLFLSCNSWYLGANIPGKSRMFMPYAAGFPTYAAQCAEEADGGYAGCRLTTR